MPSLPQLQDFLRSRHCPPPPAMESDSCLSWKSLHVTQPGCGCKRNVVALHDACLENTVTTKEEFMTYTRTEFGNSTCSDQATLRGPRQHVLVYGAGVMDDDHLDMLNQTLHQVKELYPGWVVRLYTHATTATEKPLCDLLCQHQHFDLCEVSKLTHRMFIYKDSDWSGWRWWVLGDPLVAVWEARKMGAAVTPREAHAVTQFINSEKCWHVQRDHELQSGPIGSGFIGGKSMWGQEDFLNLRKHLLNELYNNGDETLILEDVLAPMLQQDTMVHSSVLCWKDSGAVAFPSKRQPGEWVGMTLEQQKSVQITLQTNLELKHILKKKEKEEKQSTHKKKYGLNKDKGTNKIKFSNQNETQKTEVVDDSKLKSVLKYKSQGQIDKHSAKRNLLKQTKAKIQNLSQKSLSKTAVTPVKMLNVHDINLSQGIATCPGQCRPLLHPDWEYC